MMKGRPNSSNAKAGVILMIAISMSFFASAIKHVEDQGSRDTLADVISRVRSTVQAQLVGVVEIETR